ncbi:MAG: ribosome silencing factor [Peptoniphilaceae bacterium]|uniref:ribosome silencing factor n=1 Tax=Parvimonas sp. TaxID=1944660 RepID=UPI0025E29168|nr:ribosome silencing factor [Parvimonas sp.]MCI5997705.1 ribosome silencing factor [Parvimonas sp.]MDD7765559.1 ribosome silencing factor [Peptoniphilaceae bacterium]MDY3051100.1 ribosome silencing factor [Parvimonas sp.]
MEKLDLILKTLDDKIAENVVTIDLKGKSSVAEYFIIANGGAVNHNQAICDEIISQLKENNMDYINTEGYRDGNWILCDCGDIIVHIMTKDYRNYYNLERLWS